MRSVLISDKKTGNTKSIEQSQYNKTAIEDIEHKTVVFNKVKHIVKTIESRLFPISTISEKKNNSVVSSILPFRVRITNIGIPAYGPNNVPPIGIAIVGFNNYIL